MSIQGVSFSVDRSSLFGSEQTDRGTSWKRVSIWKRSRSGTPSEKVETLPRLRGRGKHRIDYRHVIDWLVRKPGAFENYRYREAPVPDEPVPHGIRHLL